MRVFYSTSTLRSIGVLDVTQSYQGKLRKCFV